MLEAALSTFLLLIFILFAFNIFFVLTLGESWEKHSCRKASNKAQKAGFDQSINCKNGVLFKYY